jgi:predicted glycoside hydrolase/deacetylase ChbG (UPF0249 family)
MPNLILNADDFGLTPGINRAIAELHCAGALTSATLMACGPAFEDAVRIARAYPSLGVGCHIVLVDGTPTAPPSEVPTLLEGEHFHTSLIRFLYKLHTGKIREEEIEREAIAQIRKLQSAGIHPTHVDTHKHTHIFPRVTRPILRAAVACGITAIRNPIEPGWSSRVAHNALRRRVEVAILRNFERTFLRQPQIVSDKVLTTEGCLGISATGSLDAETLAHLLRIMPGGTWELVTHPGYNDADLDIIATRLKSTRAIEYEALKAQIPQNRMTKQTFADLNRSPARHP